MIVRSRTPTRRSTPLRALVVLAHPRADSYTHAVADAAIDGLRAGGHAVEVIDLYAEGFRPAMSLQERRAYETDEPLVEDHTHAHAELVRWCDAIVFVYPTWWSGLPAILKGWLERVLVVGVAFRFHERTGKVRPGLKRMRFVVGISTYGSPWAYVKAVNDNGRRILHRALRVSCGPRTRRVWLGLYAIDTSTAAERTAFLERVRAQMAGLGQPRRARRRTARVPR